MKWIWILIMVVLATSVSAEYNFEKDYCDGRQDFEQFIAHCPSDHRIDGDWFKFKHYINNESVSFCEKGELFQINCSYTILNWNHPDVVGAGFEENTHSLQTQESEQIPEFSTITSTLALIGASVIYFRKRK